MKRNWRGCEIKKGCSFKIENIDVEINGNICIRFYKKENKIDINIVSYSMKFLRRAVENFINLLKSNRYNMEFDRIVFWGNTKIFDENVIEFPLYFAVHDMQFCLYEICNVDGIKIEYINKKTNLEDIIKYIEQINPQFVKGQNR